MFLSLEKIMLMLPATGQSRDSFRLQVQQAVEDFCLQYAQHADFVQYISDYYAHKIGEQQLLRLVDCLHMLLAPAGHTSCHPTNAVDVMCCKI